MMTAESRDFSVATYSVVSLTETALTSCSFTGTPPGPWGAPLAGPLLQATPSAVRSRPAKSAVRERGRL